jgi:hypothetical protein
LHKVEWLSVGISIAIGWDTSLRELANGSGVQSGTMWLLALSFIATVGGVLLFAAHRRSQRLLAGLALVLVAVSPTVFAYPINILVVALAVAELVGPRGARPPMATSP